MKTISSRETVVGRGRGRGGKSRIIFFLRKYKVVSTPQIFCLVYLFTVLSFFLLLQFRNTETFAASGLCNFRDRTFNSDSSICPSGNDLPLLRKYLDPGD